MRPDESAGSAGLQRASRRVKVTGGQVGAIGDYATIFQFFAQASSALSSLIRVAEFQPLVDERTRNFVGREFVFASIDEALGDDDFPSGYIVIRGEPGIGKTALMGMLVKERGCVHHFNIAPQGIRSPQAFLSNVSAQLIVRYELDHPALPAEATQDGGFLSRLLFEAAANADNLPLVIVVDALDEADDTGLTAGANRLFLPPSLPRGVYFIVSSRFEDDTGLFADTERALYLREDDPKNLEDVGKYIEEYVRSGGDKMAAAIERWNLSESEFAAELTAKSEGNFMYLVHALRDIRNGALTAANMDDIRSLPQGLRAYYRRHWNDMRGADQEQFRLYQEPVVCLLATVREPVSLAQLIEWTREYWRRSNWDSAALDLRAVKDVLDAWREFLNVDETDPNGERYRVYHASFQDFLKDEIGLAVYHETISETALAKIPGFLDGER